MTHWNTLGGERPRIIAHRGASGYLPEHTLAGYTLAVEQGADVIEPDLVMSRDGVLHARHDRVLSPTTDIARRSEFSTRQREHEGTCDWWTCDLDADEIARLRSMQRRPERPHDHDGEYPVPRFDQILSHAKALAQAHGRAVTVYPEIKHPVFFREHDLDPLPALVADLQAAGMTGPDAPVWLQCVNHDVLREAYDACGNPCFALLEQLDPGASWTAWFAQLAPWARGIAPGLDLLWDAQGNDSRLVATAHAAGLEVHAWTFRDDDDPAPFESPREAMRKAFELGVDALFCDFPDTAVALREQHFR